MTENLLQKLEEKMMTLLTEVEDLRAKLQDSQQSNAALLLERENHARKIQDLISLLDTVSPVVEQLSPAASTISPIKPIYIQDKVLG